MLLGLKQRAETLRGAKMADTRANQQPAAFPNCALTL
jgi:hypothetical protein